MVAVVPATEVAASAEMAGGCACEFVSTEYASDQVVPFELVAAIRKT